MPRPKRPRWISKHPEVKEFAPEGVSDKGEVTLSYEEYEAIRLVDFQGKDQAEASGEMNVSRQTFGRVLRQARYNLSKAIVTGRRLKVEGGCYELQRPGKGRRRRRGRNLS